MAKKKSTFKNNVLTVRFEGQKVIITYVENSRNSESVAYTQKNDLQSAYEAEQLERLVKGIRKDLVLKLMLLCFQLGTKMDGFRRQYNETPPTIKN